MSRDRKNGICLQTLKRADEFLRRACRERRFKVKRGRRIEALAALYNIMKIGQCQTYEAFLTWYDSEKVQP